MRLWLYLFAVICSQALLTSAAPPENPVMLLVGEIPAVTAHAGDTVTVVVPLIVTRGYHVNANPAASEDYIPLEVKFDSTGDAHPGTAVYPQGRKWRLEGSTEDLLVYSGNVELRIPLVVDRGARTGNHVLEGALDYQACNNQVCFLPESRPIAVTLEILKSK